jgi:hypothetical protein
MRVTPINSNLLYYLNRIRILSKCKANGYGLKKIKIKNWEASARLKQNNNTSIKTLKTHVLDFSFFF